MLGWISGLIWEGWDLKIISILETMHQDIKGYSVLEESSFCNWLMNNWLTVEILMMSYCK
jgi:hypothetical protein